MAGEKILRRIGAARAAEKEMKEDWSDGMAEAVTAEVLMAKAAGSVPGILEGNEILGLRESAAAEGEGQVQDELTVARGGRWSLEFVRTEAWYVRGLAAAHSLGLTDVVAGIEVWRQNMQVMELWCEEREAKHRSDGAGGRRHSDAAELCQCGSTGPSVPTVSTVPTVPYVPYHVPTVPTVPIVPSVELGRGVARYGRLWMGWIIGVAVAARGTGRAPRPRPCGPLTSYQMRDAPCGAWPTGRTRGGPHGGTRLSAYSQHTTSGRQGCMPRTVGVYHTRITHTSHTHQTHITLTLHTR